MELYYINRYINHYFSSPTSELIASVLILFTLHYAIKIIIIKAHMPDIMEDFGAIIEPAGIKEIQG
jgi:hypothetical protein